MAFQQYFIEIKRPDQKCENTILVAGSTEHAEHKARQHFDGEYEILRVEGLNEEAPETFDPVDL